MNYNYRAKKIVLVLNAKLETGVALNVAGHLSVALGYHATDHMGRDCLIDASGERHLGISKYPIIITKVKGGKLKTSMHKAKLQKDLLVVDYPSTMYETGHDDELAEALSKQDADELEYYGYIMYGNVESIDSISGKFSLWK